MRLAIPILLLAALLAGGFLFLWPSTAEAPTSEGESTPRDPVTSADTTEEQTRPQPGALREDMAREEAAWASPIETLPPPTFEGAGLTLQVLR
ncbi:MAG: hypothetical protein ACYSU1_07035, partial [Planctomycetota bacterium]